MNADLLAMLGAGAGGVAGNGGNNRRDEGKTILSIKAGMMDHTLQPNGKYMVTPNLRRGEINLIWQTQPTTASGTNVTTAATSTAPHGTLKFEWRDRRTRSVEHDATIFPEDQVTYTKVDTGREGDRVYLFQYANSDRRHFFWMQDKSADADGENAEKFQRFLSTPSACAAEAAGGEGGATGAAAPAAGTGAAGGAAGASSLDLSGIAGQAGSASALDNAALVQIMQGIGAGAGGAGGGGGAGSTTPSNAAAGTAGGVDALSSILQNMGMPPPQQQQQQQQQQQASGTTPATGGAAATPSGTVGTLTLADLQGAMAGLATSSPPPPGAAGAPGPPLSEVASASAVESSGILDDPEVRRRLIELLPENQRTEQDLMENLRSPQVQQSLKSLTSALAGDASTYHDVIVNFQMKPEDGAAALASGNPIQAFLDCLVASVEKEKKDKESGDNEEEKGEAPMEE